MRLPTTVRGLRRAGPRRLAVVPLLVAPVLLGLVDVTAPQPLRAPRVAGPSGAVNSPPSYTITGAPGSRLRWVLCQDVASTCVEGTGNGQLATGALPPGGASTADGVYVLGATQALNGETSSPAVVSFTLDRAAPPVPTAVRATGVAGSARPAFAWKAGEPAGSFTWELAPDGGAAGRPEVTGKVDGPSATVDRAVAEGPYRFRVRQVDEAGNLGPWSGAVAVTVGPATGGEPNPPNITSGPPTPGNATPTFTWQTGAPPGTDSFTWQIVQGRTVVVGPTTTTETQAVVSAPLEAGSYSFRVVEIAPSGATSAPARMDFTITEAPTPPSLTGLVLTPGVAQIGLVWSLADGTDVAAILIVRRSDASPEGPLDPAATPIELPADARSHVDVGLTADATYFYALYARTSLGAYSPVAATGSATAQAPPPPPPVVPPAVITEPPAPPPPTQPAATAQSVTPVKPKPKPTIRKPGQKTLTLNAKRLRPGVGVSVRFLQPQLRWNDRSGGAQLYNLQIFDAKGRKIHKAFPRGRKYIVPPNILRAGQRYYWRVWPWYGPVRKFSPAPLGISYFQVKGPIIPQ